MMDGTIWMESQAGLGSTFCFTARFGISHNATPKRRLDMAALRNLPALVIDDNRTNRVQGRLRRVAKSSAFVATGPRLAR